VTIRKLKNQGMNWIRPEKRLAIYLRDGLACVYCGSGCERDRLTLDHLTPYSKSGSNDPSNLVTCCLTCNSTRGAKSWRRFAPPEAKAFILNATRRVLDVESAKKIIARRGGFSNALQNLSRAA
jgi:5-methylcytosine-specific restriction endonuclease McrA